MANGEPTWYTDAIARMDNGEWVERRVGQLLMSDLDKAFIRVVPFEDYDALAARLAEAERLLRESAPFASLKLCTEIVAFLSATDSAEPRESAP